MVDFTGVFFLALAAPADADVTAADVSGTVAASIRLAVVGADFDPVGFLGMVTSPNAGLSHREIT
jgi:hypothetical protein